MPHLGDVRPVAGAAAGSECRRRNTSEYIEIRTLLYEK